MIVLWLTAGVLAGGADVPPVDPGLPDSSGRGTRRRRNWRRMYIQLDDGSIHCVTDPRLIRLLTTTGTPAEQRMDFQSLAAESPVVIDEGKLLDSLTALIKGATIQEFSSRIEAMENALECEAEVAFDNTLATMAEEANATLRKRREDAINEETEREVSRINAEGALRRDTQQRREAAEQARRQTEETDRALRAWLLGMTQAHHHREAVLGSLKGDLKKYLLPVARINKLKDRVNV